MEFSLSYASHYIIATLHVATPKKIATEDTDGASRDTPLIVGRKLSCTLKLWRVRSNIQVTMPCGSRIQTLHN